MPTEEWSRVPARDAIGLLSTACNNSCSRGLRASLAAMGDSLPTLFVAVLELVRVEALQPYFRGQVGRPEEDHAALSRAFIAKAVFDVPKKRRPDRAS